VFSRVFGPSQDFEVLASVIVSFPISMMNDLVLLQSTTKHLLSDESVLIGVPMRLAKGMVLGHGQCDIAMTRPHSAAVPVRIHCPACVIPVSTSHVPTSRLWTELLDLLPLEISSLPCFRLPGITHGGIP
jgi:hypothetical protein